MILPSSKLAAAVAIKRLGDEATILEPTGSTTDGYGKTREAAFSAAATEWVARFYTGGSEPSMARVAGSRYRTDSPVLVLNRDTVATEGFRVEFPAYGETFEIDSLTRYPTHFEASTTVVN